MGRSGRSPRKGGVKRLKKGDTPVTKDAAGKPRDVTGHRTDLPPLYNHLGKRLWRAEELTYAQGERVRATKTWHRMEVGECGTIFEVSTYTLRDYWVIPDHLMDAFANRRSGEFLSRMPEHYLEPE